MCSRPDDPTQHDAKPPLQLTGEDGNAFAIMGRAAKALRAAGRAKDVPAYQAEAMAGNYDHLLVVTMDWFEVS